MEQISWILTPELLEMILLLPWSLFYLLATMSLFPFPNLPSPAVIDLQEGRNTVTVYRIEDILLVCICMHHIFVIYVYHIHIIYVYHIWYNINISYIRII